VKKAFLFVGILTVAVSACSASTPNSAGACEQYFDAADRVTEIVDLYFDDLGSISQEQRLLLASEYTGAIRDQAGQALILNLAMASEGLDTGAFGEDVQDLVALLSVQVQSLDSGSTNDVTTLLRIQRLENQIAVECRKIGGDV
jgi:hypothetical protein